MRSNSFLSFLMSIAFAWIMCLPAHAQDLNEISKLIPNDGSVDDFFGDAVAISGDYAIVGSYWDDDNGSNSGSAHVFYRNQGGTDAWGYVTKLLAPDGVADDLFGRAIAMYGDYAVVGAYQDDDNGPNSGSAYIYNRNQGGTDAWGYVTKITASDGTNDDIFGRKMAMDGDYLIVGANGDDDKGSAAGAAYIFNRNQGGADAWGQVSKLTASDGAASDNFGAQVSISGDYAVVGASGDDNITGSAYLYSRDQGGSDAWGQVIKLVADDRVDIDGFGNSVSISGDNIIIGTPYDDDHGYNSGSVYFYSRNQGGTDAWGQVTKVNPDDGLVSDRFGSSVSISGDYAFVGAHYDDENGEFSGLTYVLYRHKGGTDEWGIVSKAKGTDTAAEDYLGISVALSGEHAIAGAHGDDIYASQSGSAYIFAMPDASLIAGWTTGTSMPTAREGMASCTSGGKLYVVGGDNGGDRNDLEIYDPATDSWTTGSSMPTARQSLALGAIDGKLYALGGYHNGTLSTLEIYDTATNVWTTGPSMSVMRRSLVVGVVDGKLYAVGGHDASSQVATLEIYDPATNAWTTGSAMPTARDYLAAAVIDGKFYVIGGQTGVTPGAVLEIYDPSTNAWTTGPSMPSARETLAACAIGGKLYVVGGLNDGPALNTMEIYSPVTNSWITGPAMPSARYALAASAISGKLYAVGGGAGGGSRFSTLEIYDASISDESLFSGIINTTTWTVANSPYHVVGTITLPSGNTLTIEPGVDVLFDADVQFVIEGSLNAVGTETDSIRFAKSTAAAWGGIRFYGSGSSTISWSKISGSNSGGVFAEGASVTLERCTISDNNILAGQVGAGIVVSHAASMTLNWCLIVRNTGALNGGALYVGNGAATLNNCTISGNSATSGAGGFFVNNSATVNLTNSILWGNTGGSYSINAGSFTANYSDIEGNYAGTDNIDADPLFVDAANGDYSLQFDSPCIGTAGDGGDMGVFSRISLIDWVEKDALNTGRQSFATATWNGKIYASSGYSYGGSRPTTTEEYDPITDTWVVKASIPVQRNGHRFVTVGDRIYAFGGEGPNSGSWTPTVYEYDPAGDSWTQKGNWTARNTFVADAIDGKIYAAGGVAGYGGPESSTYEYDPSSDTWTQKAAMLTAVNTMTGASAGGKLYVFGGHNGSAYIDLVQCYDPVSNTWEYKESLPVIPGNTGTATTVGDTIFVFARVGGSLNNTVLKYFIGTDTWETVSSEEVRAQSACSVYLDGYIYYIGGITNGSPSTIDDFELTTYAWDVGDAPEDAWRLGPNLSYQTQSAAACFVNGEYHIFGGLGPGSWNLLNQHSVYSPITKLWRSEAVLPQARGYMGVAVYNGLIYVVGGDIGNTQVTTVEIYDPVAKTWSAGPPLPAARAYAEAVNLNGKLHVIGGYLGSGAVLTHWVLNDTEDGWDVLAPHTLSGLYANEAVVIGAQIYLLGGTGGGATSNAVAIYNSVSNTWIDGPSMLQSRAYFDADVRDGEIWAVAGHHWPDPPNYLQAVEIFNPVSQTWRHGPPLSQSRYGISVAGDGATLYATGGYNSGETLPTFEIIGPDDGDVGDTSVSATLVLPELYTAPGGVVVVPISASYAGLISADLAFTFDPTVLTPSEPFIVSHVFDEYPASYLESSVIGDTVRVSLTWDGNNAVWLDNELIVELAFDVAAGLTPGVQTSLSWLDYPMTHLNEMVVDSVNGFVEIKAILWGDVTDNGTLTALDASWILQHVVQTRANIYEAVGDVSDNGYITSFDAALVLYKIIHPTYLFPVNGGLPPLVKPASLDLSWKRDDGSWLLVIAGTNLPIGADLVLRLPEGVTLSSDAALAWHREGELVTVSVASSVAINELLRVDGMATAPEAISTVVNERAVSVVQPLEFTLHQNTPNPFNPSTTIRFSLPEAGATTLAVYSIMGQLVHVVIERDLGAGLHEIVWDGRDDSGRNVASGVYLYRLEWQAASPGSDIGTRGSQVRRLLLVR
jgi:N-acetylneuraminic acid mutarotase